MVEVEDELVVGYDPASHAPVFSPVVDLSHREFSPGPAFLFVEIHTANATVTITPDHRIFVQDPATARATDISAAQLLDSIATGAPVHLVQGHGRPVPVRWARLVYEDAIHSPVTAAGLLLAGMSTATSEGLLTSCYAGMPHTSAHWFVWAWRGLTGPHVVRGAPRDKAVSVTRVERLLMSVAQRLRWLHSCHEATKTAGEADVTGAVPKDADRFFCSLH